ncbi:MAG: T9SS C-terminal target domain-containing protein [Croceitalea sp.]|nr:T9SS C-terminal target domain-containing protein [Croceitalea sp.]
MKSYLLISVFLLTMTAWAQSDISALGNLPMQVNETSGLIYYNNKLITHNDSDTAPELYELDPLTLSITRTITISNALNIDWEDITQDENYIYVGDIGNNSGNRQDLSILKIAKADFDVSNLVTAEIISFTYEDQTIFETAQNSDFDAESLFVMNDELIVLTKQWQSLGTVAYALPKIPGVFVAERVDAYQIDGLVTGATYDSATNQLFLVGYSQFLTPFFVQITEVRPNSIFNGTVNKLNLAIGQAQVEAITLNSEGLFYITSEEYSNPPILNSPSQLYSFSLDEDQVEEEEEEKEEEEVIDNPSEFDQSADLVLFKTFDSSYLNYSLKTDKTVVRMAIFDSMGRMVSSTPLENMTDEPIDLSTLSPSLYYLSFFLVDGVISAPFLRN